MDSWQPEEALVRLSLALSQQRVGRAADSFRGRRPSERSRVAIADDDPTVLALVRTALANFGMECYTAVDGPSALETIRAYRPHAAVLDVNMPGMDGYEVLSAVRKEEIPVRVLLLTARQQESDVIRGFTLGADDYVVKPFSPMELVARMKRLALAMIRVELSVAACLLGVYALFLIAMFAVLWSGHRAAASSAVTTQGQTPQIRDALVDYLSGSNDQTRIREFLRANRGDMVDALLQFHGTVGGSARDRLCDLALELALVHDWCQDAGSKDRVRAPQGLCPAIVRVRL